MDHVKLEPGREPSEHLPGALHSLPNPQASTPGPFLWGLRAMLSLLPCTSIWS